MALTYRVEPLPATWPGKRHAHWVRSPFKTQWSRTLDLLEREIAHLGGRDVVFHLEIRGPRDLRNDGQLRADARPGRAVIVRFKDRHQNIVQLAADQYGWWQDNLYAIARTMENLRAVDRWGVANGRQYEGFKALPGAGASTPTMEVSDAASIVASFSEFEAHRIRTDPGIAQLALRQAVFRTHPDRNNGDREYYDSVEEAKKILQRHHGGAL